MKKNIFLFLTSCIIMLPIAEIAIRMSGIYDTYLERSGGRYISPYSMPAKKISYILFAPHHPHILHQNEFSVIWTANNEGFDDKDFTVPKNGIRIMMLGDSYTEGVGADNDSSFPRQLAYLLHDSFPHRTEVWNCGVSGSDPIYEFRLFDDKLIKYNPDMVMVVINFSDIDDAVARGGFERFRPDSSASYKKGPWFEPLYARCHIVRALVHFVFRYNRLFIRQQDVAIRKQEALTNLEAAMDSFTEVCNESNIKLLFVFHPNEPDMSNKTEYAVKPLIKYCEKKKLPYIDVREELYRMGINSSNANLLFWPIDGHCTDRGYRYFAHCIWRKVRQELEN